MEKILKEILNWSEAWALLIPIITLLIVRPKGKWIRPVKIYIFLAFIICLVGNLIWLQARIGLHDWLFKNFPGIYESNGTWTNTLLYNIHSIVRWLLFTWFFLTLYPVFRKLSLIIVPIFVAGTAILFIFYEDIRDFSSILLAFEAAILLVYCILYYFIMIRRDYINPKQQPFFWAVTGLAIYVVINFPIFLFFTALAVQAYKFAVNIWDVHNISYIIFCIFLAISFYKTKYVDKDS